MALPPMGAGIPAMLLFVKSQAIPALIQLLQVEDAITTENAAFALALVCSCASFHTSFCCVARKRLSFMLL